MFDVEIVIAPLLVLVILVAAFIEKGLVKVLGIALKEIGRGQVGSSAEPPSFRYARICRIFDFKVAIVEMDSGRRRVVRMNNTADAKSLEWECFDAIVPALQCDQHKPLLKRDVRTLNFPS